MINNNIKQIRLSLGMKRSEFAQLLGISYGAVCNYEYGTRNPRLNTCYRIIEVAKKHKIKIKLEDIYPRFTS